MKTTCLALGIFSITLSLVVDSLPVITLQPQSLVTNSSGNPTFSVSATGATSYQWCFNGTNLPGATGSTLVVSNAQVTNTGYYLALAKNATGWVPSQLAYLSVVDTAGSVPFSNFANTNARVYSSVNFQPQPANGTAQLLAGPQLDQMQLVSPTTPITLTNGYYSGGVRNVANVTGGQTMYYQVLVQNNLGYSQLSTTISVTAGGNGFSTPSVSSLIFPLIIEWPYPTFFIFNDVNPTNLVSMPGETASFQIMYYNDSILPAVQWRKDGINIPNATNNTVTITNVQPADAGVYDAIVIGEFQPAISPRYFLTVQTTNGTGLFTSPRISGSNFLSDLQGMPGRAYAIQWSSNLANWNGLLTLTNGTGTITFSNGISSGSRFYRAILQ
jgi:hypothetical protein